VTWRKLGRKERERWGGGRGSVHVKMSRVGNKMKVEKVVCIG